MSWSSARSRRRLAGAAWLAVAAGLLSGCGFQRTYALHEGGGSPVREAMSQVQIAPIPERVGQVVRNRLLDRFTPTGQPSRPAYWLEVKLSEDTHGVSLAHDETITRYNYALSANFRLTDANSGTLLLADRAHAVTPYNVTRSEFATVVSGEDAADRAAELIADQIEGRVAGYFGQASASR